MATSVTSTLACLNWVDYSIIGIIVLSMLLSLTRGFVREFLSIVTWIFAFWVAFQFGDSLAPRLAPYIQTPSLRVMASLVILFVLTLIVGSLVNFLLSKLLATTGLGGIDRLLGMIFGLARGILLIGITLLLISLTGFSKDPWYQNSVLVPRFQPLVTWLNSFLPDKVEHISNTIHHQIADGIDKVTK